MGSCQAVKRVRLLHEPLAPVGKSFLHVCKPSRHLRYRSWSMKVKRARP